ADGQFDAVLSVFGSMFAPDHRRTAAEMLRATRPGGRIALASWTPDGFVGQMFRVISRYVAPPPGLVSPLMWGTVDHLASLFGSRVADARSGEQVATFRSRPALDYV